MIVSVEFKTISGVQNDQIPFQSMKWLEEVRFPPSGSRRRHHQENIKRVVLKPCNVEASLVKQPLEALKGFERC